MKQKHSKVKTLRSLIGGLIVAFGLFFGLPNEFALEKQLEATSQNRQEDAEDWAYANMAYFLLRAWILVGGVIVAFAYPDDKKKPSK